MDVRQPSQRGLNRRTRCLSKASVAVVRGRWRMCVTPQQLEVEVQLGAAVVPQAGACVRGNSKGPQSEGRAEQSMSPPQHSVVYFRPTFEGPIGDSFM